MNATTQEPNSASSPFTTDLISFLTLTDQEDLGAFDSWALEEPAEADESYRGLGFI